MDRPVALNTNGLAWPIAPLKPPLFVHKYGYYEIRCKLQKQPGWWSAFWLQSPVIGSSLNPSQAGVELDVMENFTRDNRISHNIHWGGYGDNHLHKGSGDLSIADAAEGFHTFGMDWSKSGYVFYVDGKASWRIDGPVSDVEQFILVSTECNGYRGGNRNQPAAILKRAVLPDAFIVDYVRVFDKLGDKQ